MPIIEFQVFKSEKFTVLSGLGMSYFTEKYHPEKNLQNKAITTDLCWAFKMILNYKFYDSGNIDWRAGLGYSHHSNGHTKLMNNGFNSFLLSTSADIRTSSKVVEVEKPYFRYEKTTYEYFNFRFGLGQNVFATTFNKRKDVYSVSGEYGHVYNNTFKIGMGIYYRFYEHYYNYIQNNESLTQPGWEFEHYHNNPWHYATSLGLSINGEVLLNHVGIEVQVGYNLYKPSYKIEWRINNGWENTPQEIPEKWKLGELDSYFKWKYRISSKLGIKYYLIGLENKPQNNFYIGANLNANLGQADFTELSLGYVHSFNFKKSE